MHTCYTFPKAAPWHKSLLMLTMALVFAAAFTGCKDDDDTSVNTQDLIKRTWVLAGGSITKDDVSVADQYTGLTITFSTNGTYTTTNAGDLFESSGTWTWVNATATALVLDGALAVNVPQLTATDLQLTFTLQDDSSSGRLASTAGDYVVKLKSGN